MPTAFVTGGTGFIGLNLVSLLATEGWDVVAIHRPRSNVAPLRALGVKLQEAELGDPAAIRRAMPDEVDVVFHIAGSTATWWGANAEQTRTNVDGTRHVVEAALARRARRFVHTSSVATYGTLAYRRRIDERTPSDGATHWVNYIRTKWLGERLVHDAVSRGLEAVALNPMNIIGPHDAHNWSRLFRLVAREQLPGVPPGVASWSDVREVARAHLAAAERGRTGENYLLGGVDASYAEVCSLVAELTGTRAPKPLPAWAFRTLARVNECLSRVTRREPDVTPEGAFLVCGTGTVDCSKAQRELGFRPLPLRPTVEDTLGWMREAELIP